ncbi:hypothetical protein J6590_021676 [Homalodisca vitripennis]|nr:hypothetical protein J6590_021676 [Homalodisca vitripennis]
MLKEEDRSSLRTRGVPESWTRKIVSYILWTPQKSLFMLKEEDRSSLRTRGVPESWTRKIVSYILWYRQ